MNVGDTLAWTRTFTEEDIALFAKLSGDAGEHHLIPDEKGRLMAHGLLTATLPTKIGGDLNLIAREMVFRFHRPVFAGDTIECVVTLTSAKQAEGFWNVVRMEMHQSEWQRSDDGRWHRDYSGAARVVEIIVRSFSTF